MVATKTPPATERAALGAAWLDQKLPGWWKKVKVGRLELCDTGNCVLGQLFGDESSEGYFRAQDVLLIDQETCRTLGFDMSLEATENEWLPDDDPRSDYSQLTKAWRAEIARRRKARKLVNA